MWIEREKCGLRGRKVNGEVERWMEMEKCGLRGRNVD